MARIRTINTDELFFDDEMTSNYSAAEILVYIRLWCIAEDWGGFDWDPNSIKLKMGGIKITTAQIKNFLDKMVAMKKIILYKKNGKTIGWLKNFLKHQRITNPSSPQLPLPEWIKFKKKKYPNGKSYAEYEIIESKLPVDYYYLNNGTNNKKEKNNNSKPNNTTPFFAPIKDYFIEAYRKKFNSDPAISFGAEGRLINNKRGLFTGVKEAYKLIDDFLVSAKAEECGYTLSVCFSAHTINLWKAGKLRRKSFEIK